MNERFWFILCSLFLAYNLKVLFDDFYSVNYKIVEVDDELYDETTTIAACTLAFFLVGYNDGEFRNAIKIKPTMVTSRSLLNESIAMIESRLDKNLFRLDESYIFRGFFCFRINKTALHKNPMMRKFLKDFYIQLFAHSPEKQPFFSEYIYYMYHNQESMKVVKQKVYGPRYLASSDCRSHRDHRGQFLASKFNCLRKCAFNSPADFHPPDNHELFNLSDLINVRYNPLDIKNSTIQFGRYSNKEALKKCSENCPKEDCFSETYNSISFGDNNTAEIHFENAIYTAFYSTTQFSLQLFGLFSLFTGTSVTYTVPHLMRMAAKNLKATHQARFVRILPKIKLALIIFSAAFLVVQSIQAIIDHKFERSFPNRTIIWNFSSEPFSLFICLPIETLVYNDKEIKKGRNSKILSDLSFKHLEEETRAFENGVEVIKLLHGNQVNNLNWTMTEKVLFKNSSFDRKSCMSRCFRIELHFEELKYRQMMPVYYLMIQFRTKFREVYLTERHQNFSSGLVDFNGDYFVQKTTEKALPGSRKSNCKEMRTEESRVRQIDRCINQKFVANYSALPMNSVVDKDDFGDEIQSFKFEEANTTAIEQACLETVGYRKSCNEVRFEVSMKKTNFYDKSSIRLNLNYEHSISKEIDQSPIMVLLYILNLESLLFRNNIASCLLFVIAILKRIFKLNWSNRKLDRYLVLSLCLLGFLAHNVFVFRGIIDGELAENGYFQKMHQFALPNVAFCFDLSELQFDANHRMTGNYLNTMTEELRFGKIIDKIIYFNRTHYKEFWPEGGSSNYSDSDIRISPFYLLDTLYCLELQLKVKFDEEDFYILYNKFIFWVFFKRSFTNRIPKTYLFYRQPDQKEISDLLEHQIRPDEKGNEQIYEIILELIEVDRSDEFEDLKDPRRLFFGKRKTVDVNEYLNEIQAKFREGNLANFTTNELPLEPADFDKEINNQLFKQLFLQVINVTDHLRPISLNSKLTFFNFYSKRISAGDPGDPQFFQFAFLPIKKRVEILNRDNFAKLSQDILNSLSLWLDILIIDLVVYVNWLFDLAPKLYGLLITARDKLRSNCFN